MSRLRSYGPMKRRSDKTVSEQTAYEAVYRLVDQRSEGQCEYWAPAEVLPGVVTRIRCLRRATDHHHTVKPRRSNHTAELVVHLCRHHHDRCEWPYHRGRLVVTPLGSGQFRFELRHEKREAHP